MTTKTTTQTITTAAYTLASGNAIIAASGDGADVNVANSFVNAGTITAIAATSDTGISFLDSSVLVNQSTGFIEGANFAVVGGQNLTLTNFGIIEEPVTQSNDNTGAVEVNGASVINNAGTILGGHYGLQLRGRAAVTNSGTVNGLTGAKLSGGGTFNNSGLLDGSGGSALWMTDGGTLNNTGAIYGKGGGGGEILITGAPGYVDNHSGGIISATGVSAIVITAGGTVTNAGSVGSNTGVAVTLSGGSSTLVDDPGAVFTGKVVASTTGGAVNTIVLGSGSSAGTVTNPANYIGFTGATVANGADWSLGGSISGVASITDDGTLNVTGPLGATTINAGGPGAGSSVNFNGTYTGTTITNFGPGDFINVGTAALPFANGGTTTLNYNSLTGNLDVTEGAKTVTLHVFGDVIPANLTYTSSGATGVDISQTPSKTVTLTPSNDPSSSPYTVPAGGGIAVTNGDAVVNTNPAGFIPTLVNHGFIAAGTAGSGIDLSGTAPLGTPGAVLNNSGAISGGQYGAQFTDGGASPVQANITNSGKITEAAPGATTGATAGLVFGPGVSGTILNSGVISAQNGPGIELNAPGTATASDTIINSGTIASATGTPSILLNFGTTGSALIENIVSAGQTGTITHGIELQGGSSPVNILNAGTIGAIGGTGPYAKDAIFSQESGTLTLDPGQVLGGAVTFGAGSVIDLAAGATTGTLSNPSSYTGFTSLTVQSGANWQIGSAAAPSSITGIATLTDYGTLDIAGTLTGTSINLEGNNAHSIADFTGTDVANGTLGTALTNFGNGDKIILAASDFTVASGDAITGTYNAATGQLDVTDTTKGTKIAINVNVPASASSTGTVSSPFNFQYADGPGGFTITELPCFAHGTLILTESGEIPVQDIAVGDVLVTVRENGPTTRNVVWTGSRSVDITRHPVPEEVRPVRIAAGALGPNIPARDLRVSPHHAIYIEGNLFEAISLVNGVTIFQEQATTHITYHHIELDSHDILLAEGLPAESFLDTGNKPMFEGGPVITLHPDFRTQAAAAFCAPLILEGPELAATRAALAARITAVEAA